MEDLTLGGFVRHHRLQQGLMQEELAEKAGKSQKWVSNLENDRYQSIREPALSLLAGAIKVTVGDILVRIERGRSAKDADRIQAVMREELNALPVRKAQVIQLARSIEFDDDDEAYEWAMRELRSIAKAQARRRSREEGRSGKMVTDG